jgi:hypothetical protein
MTVCIDGIYRVNSSTVKHLLSNSAIIPLVVTVLCLAPFVGKAFHMDDTVFIWCAKQIHISPIDFYGFEANWYGTETLMAENHYNPPGVCYYIALGALLLGWSEVALHMAFLVPAVAVALGAYYLAREFCSLAVLAVLAAVLTPAFLVSGTNVMCDTMTLALWVWAVVLWVRGMKRDNNLSLFFAAVLVAICALTKYVGIGLLGLLFVYSLAQRRKLDRRVLFLLIPVAILAGYEWATHTLYGRGFLLNAANYATRTTWMASPGLFSRVLIGLSFTGGCVLIPLFYSPLLWSRRLLISAAVLTILFIFGVAFAGKIGEFSIPDAGGAKWGFLGQFGLMTAAGVSILGLACVDFWKCRDADSLLLLLWVFGIFIFAGFVNWTVNARSILPMVPAVGILLMRRIDQRREGRGQVGIRQIVLPLVPAVLISVLVCWVDYKWAGIARDAAETIHERYQNWSGDVQFQGHWGFQYYMEANGYRAFDFDHPKIVRGDIIIIPSNNTSTKHFPKTRAEFREVLYDSPCRWLALGSHELGAGFYASGWGPLPFAVGPVEPEKYYVFVFK